MSYTQGGKCRQTKNFGPIADSCAASADCLEKQRSFFEKYNVFSPAMIDGILPNYVLITMPLYAAIFKINPSKMMELVEEYFHCGCHRIYRL